MNSIPITRRAFVGGSAVTAAFAGQFGFIQQLLAQDSTAKGAKACILLWMSGGPSQLDTWDPKPGTETGGEFGAIETPVRGISVSETLPAVAKEMKRFSIIRNLNQPEGDHTRATYLMHTGYRLLEASPSPAVGSMFSMELGKKPEFPQYVSIGSQRMGPAFLGYEHSPFVIGDPNAALETIRVVGEGRGRIDLMNKLQADYVKTHAGEAQAQREAMIRGLARLNDTPFAKALDLSEEPDELKDAYGRGGFGQGCLLARRLVGRGVKFVEVELGGWDTHQDNFNGVRNLCNELDPAMATLLRDLDGRGLLKDTIVLWMGEFGRTPTVNPLNGRDHFPDITPVAIAGGPIEGGRVVGETNGGGTEIKGGAVKVADLFATLYAACGIDPKKKMFNKEGKLFTTTDKGNTIKELL